MDAIQQQYARMQKTIDGIREVALDYRRIADETLDFTGLYEERRKNPNRPNRLLSYSEKKALRTAPMNTKDLRTDFDPTSVNPEDDTAVVFDCTATLDLDGDQKACPGTQLMRGQYEARLIKTLDGLRGELRHYVDRYYGPNTTAKAENLRKVRKTLDLVKKVQTVLNRTGSWSFLLADAS